MGSNPTPAASPRKIALRRLDTSRFPSKLEASANIPRPVTKAERRSGAASLSARNPLCEQGNRAAPSADHEEGGAWGDRRGACLPRSGDGRGTRHRPTADADGHCTDRSVRDRSDSADHDGHHARDDGNDTQRAVCAERTVSSECAERTWRPLRGKPVTACRTSGRYSRPRRNEWRRVDDGGGCHRELNVGSQLVGRKRRLGLVGAPSRSPDGLAILAAACLRPRPAALDLADRPAAIPGGEDRLPHEARRRGRVLGAAALAGLSVRRLLPRAGPSRHESRALPWADQRNAAGARHVPARGTRSASSDRAGDACDPRAPADRVAAVAAQGEHLWRYVSSRDSCAAGLRHDRGLEDDDASRLY